MSQTYYRDDVKLYEEVTFSYIIPFLNWPLKKKPRRKHSIALDLGSNVGAFSIIYRNNFKEIFSVEPSTLNIHSHKQNILKYQISNSTIIQKAISNNNHLSLALYKVSVDEKYSLLDFTTSEWDQDINKSGYRGKKENIEELVSSITLSFLINSIDSKIDFCKCDIEGAEYECFMNQDLSKISFLILEIHYDALGKEKTSNLINYLEKYFDYYHPKDRKSAKDYPPPQLLKLINKNNNNFILRISGRFLSTSLVIKFYRLLSFFYTAKYH